MAFSDLLSYQAVTEGDAAGVPFPLNPGQSHGSGIKCMTRTEAVTRYNLASGSLEGAGNQLMPKRAWVSGVVSYSSLITLASWSTAGGSCSGAGDEDHIERFTSSLPITIGTFIYTNSSLTTPLDGNNMYWHVSEDSTTALPGHSIQISDTGEVLAMVDCSATYYEWFFSDTLTDSYAGCGDPEMMINTFYTATTPLVENIYVYNDSALTDPVIGGYWFTSSDQPNQTFYIDYDGYLLDITTC